MLRRDNRKTKSQHEPQHSENLSNEIKGLEEEIELTIYNYQNILQTEKNSSSERADFLLYLIQSLRSRQSIEIQSLTMQLQSAEGEKEQAENMEKQMQNIGQGLDQIVDESRRLKQINQNLQKQLGEQEQKDKQLDEEISLCQKQMEECRLKVDEWERTKIRWNRHKKEISEMIEDAEEIVREEVKSIDEGSSQRNGIEELCKKYHNL